MTRMHLLAALALACVLPLSPAFAMAYPPGYEGGATGLAFGLTFIGLAFVAAGALFLLWVAPRRPIPLALAAIVGVLWFGTAFAQEASSSALTIPWGQMVAEFSKAALEIILPVLSALAVAGAARLPWWVTMWLTTQRIDRMLKTGADYAINAVEGATHDKALSVNVGYPVIKTALERIMGSTPAWLIKEAGGAKGITERLFRVFKFDETVTDANTLSPLIRDLPTLPFAK